MNFWQFMVQNHAEIFELTLEHLWLVGISILLAVIIGIPLGLADFKMIPISLVPLGVHIVPSDELYPGYRR